MKLPRAERSRFFNELGKLLTAGFPFLRAVETMLSSRPRSATRRILEKFQTLALGGATITDSFTSFAPPFSPMEIALIAACERSGKLAIGCEFLHRYHARLDALQRQILRRSLYPLFMLHAGVVLLALPLVFQVGLAAALRQIAMELGSFYVVAAALFFVGKIFIGLSSHSVALDRLLNFLPVLGGIRRSLALSRFCTAYQMQLDAGVNVMDSLEAAGRASASAKIIRGIHSVLPAIRAGQSVGPELAQTAIFPSELHRTLVIAEQTGTLDAELISAAEMYEAKAVRGLETAGEWSSKLIYILIVAFLAGNIISAARKSTDQLNQMLNAEP